MILKLTAEKRKSRSFSLSMGWHCSFSRNFFALFLKSNQTQYSCPQFPSEILSHARRVQIVPQGQEAFPWFAAGLWTAAH